MSYWAPVTLIALPWDQIWLGFLQHWSPAFVVFYQLLKQCNYQESPNPRSEVMSRFIFSLGNKISVEMIFFSISLASSIHFPGLWAYPSWLIFGASVLFVLFSFLLDPLEIVQEEGVQCKQQMPTHLHQPPKERKYSLQSLDWH